MQKIKYQFFWRQLKLHYGHIDLTQPSIRHLILPTHTNDSVNCLKFICENLGKDSIVSIMSQYEPMYDAKNYTEINRKITPLEYKRVVNYAMNLEMKNCFTQDLSSANSKFTPKF